MDGYLFAGVFVLPFLCAAAFGFLRGVLALVLVLIVAILVGRALFSVEIGNVFFVYAISPWFMIPATVAGFWAGAQVNGIVKAMIAAKRRKEWKQAQVDAGTSNV